MSGNNYTDQLMELRKEISDLSSGMNEIKQLLGGSSFGDGGLVKMQADQIKEISNLKDEVSELKEFKKKIIGYIIGLGIGSGTAAGTVINLLFG